MQMLKPFSAILLVFLGLTACQDAKKLAPEEAAKLDLQEGWLPPHYEASPEVLRLNDLGIRYQTQAETDPTISFAQREIYLDSARHYYQKALAQDSSYGLLYSNMAALEMQEGNMTGAEKYLRQRLLQEPQLAEGWQSLGFFKDLQGDSVEAFKYYEKSLALFDSRLAQGKKYRQPENIVYYYDNWAGKSYTLLLLGQEKKCRESVNALLEEAAPIMGKEVQVYAAMLHQNRQDLIKGIQERQKAAGSPTN
ncbi:hypothetical protein PPO43_13800 [Saprospira sp. CCB-QB6]|uniref:hypothetical protein n=1 Tax=Saprospira sp. CCB-QB6 TaxID=3023936 RepID=UPI00234A7DEA|nr:hypothetical protein [Saprospira sp. CCB-QB6]WCL81043.1 hypothetical protein PPO43_13800 [Saprospira sp. CCB-QB6]